MPAPRVALLVNLGTPTAPTADAVRAFLAEFLSDPCVVDWPAWVWQPILRGIVLRRRPARVAAAYRAIWSESGAPLAVQTRALAAAVQRELGPEWDVRAAFRYGTPGLARELDALRAAGRDVRVLPLFPQRTAASSGSIERVVAASGGARLVELAPTDAGYVDALASALRAAPRESQLVVSFHSIPRRVDRAEGARYSSDCRATFDALCAAARWPRERAELCYQSRFGPEPWLGPALAERLVELARARRPVVVATPGFLTEGLETLEEIGLRGREEYERAGGAQFLRIPCPAA
ncbi:MAG: ferrochelatase, partial [Planctomycetota bacterium]